MSKHSKQRPTSPKSQPNRGRPIWLAAAALTLAGVALISMLIWLVQRNTTEIEHQLLLRFRHHHNPRSNSAPLINNE